MIRNITLKLAAFALILSAAHGCTGGVNAEAVITKEAISKNYTGTGIEWDPYDEAEAWGADISDADWAKLYERLDFMKPGYIRCMINSGWKYYDKKTGVYDKTKNIRNLRRLLDYCTKNNITVIFGEYNPPSPDMKDSQKWVEMSVDYLNYLVNVLGFRCIKYFVIFNEPDGYWSSVNGDFSLWMSMLRKFDEQMSRYPGLSGRIRFAAPDAVMGYKNPESPFNTAGWIKNTSELADSLTGIYDIHSYPGQYEVRYGDFEKNLVSLRKQVPAGKKILLGEAGYKYYKPEDSLLALKSTELIAGHKLTLGSDCNLFVYDYFYGIDMALMAMKVMNAGYSGIAAWMLDDAMHGNGDSGRTGDLKIWGMWNILGEEVFGMPKEEEIRPWFYTWSLMCRYFPEGSDILKTKTNKFPRTCYISAGIKDGHYTAAAVNFGEKDILVSLEFPKALSNASLFLYSRNKMEKDKNEFPVPIKRDMNGNSFRINIPANGFILITELPYLRSNKKSNES
ncbi:MAG: hypothetical protein LKI53_00020 [Bacteroidales bacterium]|jgi:hypothetical protein|nr:hypothetical protein [Bacteroidales bacterium]